MTSPTPGQRNCIRRCASHKKARPKPTSNADLQACLDAGWVVPGYGWYATTPAGSAAAGIEHDHDEQAGRMGWKYREGQLELFTVGGGR